MSNKIRGPVYKIFLFLFRFPVIWMIILYQKTLSPDHSWIRQRFPNGFCRFYPSCSEYGRQVIKKRGVLVGIPLSIWRVIRCNPWAKGGVDEP